MLKIRGLRFQERTIHQVERKDRLLLQAYKAALQGFTLSDPIRSLSYSLRYLRLALRLGLIDDIIFGLAQEAIHLSVAGPHKQPAINACFKCAHNLVSKRKDPLVEGYLVFALGSSASYLGDFVKAADYFEQAEKIYLEKCPGAVWEYTAMKSMYGSTLAALGRWREMQHQWDTWTADAADRGDLYMLTVQRLWPSGTYRWLAADRPDKVWALLTIGLQECPTTGDDLLKVFAAISASHTNIYCGNYLDAFHPLEKKLTAFLKTPAGKFSPFFKSIMLTRLAWAAVAHALVARNRNQILDIAEQQANMLEKANTAVAWPFVPVIRAAIAHQKGDNETARSLLQDAIRAYEKLEFKLYTAAARRQVGRIVGGNEGQSLIEWADNTMGEEDIVNPERVAAMLAPGFFL
jgi:tetratricopeptide (TPR) repeat protein